MEDREDTVTGDAAQPRTVDLTGCARCWGTGHERLTFKPLTHPFELDDGSTYTHWAPCPANGEPIMMRVTETP